MELTKSEEIKNRRVAMGITLLAFITMILFLIFKNIISSNNPNFNEIQPDQLTVGFTNGDENNAADSKKGDAPSKLADAGLSQKIASDPDNNFVVKNNARSLAEQYNARSYNSAGNEPAEGLEKVVTGIGEIKDGLPFGDNSKQGFNVPGRTVISSPKITNDTQEEGTVVVDIAVDKDGSVVEANPNGRGTTTSSSVLKAYAKQFALKTKFSASAVVAEQKGSIMVVFTFN